jgi:RNA exonuclease 1
MENVTVTLPQAQVAFLRLVSSETVLVGHGLENDLRALQVTHARCVDTSVLYAHPRGFPLRYKLKALAKDHLKIMIQRGGAGTFGGHDSAEDAGSAVRLNCFSF